MAKTPVKKDPTKAVVPTSPAGGSSVPDFLKEQLAADAGLGISEDQDDSLVPMVVVLQAQSPQCIKQKPEYIKGAEAGDIWVKNAPTPLVKGQDGILVQPVAFWKSVVEWVPKNKDGSGGGYVGTHTEMPADATEVEDDEGGKRFMSPQGTEYVETRNHAVIVYTAEGAFPYLIPLSSTGHTVSRQWMFMMKSKTIGGQRVPSFACLYRLKTVMKSKGSNTWFVLEPHNGGEDGGTAWVTPEQYAAGKALYEAFQSGAKKADMGPAAQEPVDGTAAARSAAAEEHI